jgi:hypothetical protein
LVGQQVERIFKGQKRAFEQGPLFFLGFFLKNRYLKILKLKKKIILSLSKYIL